MPNDETYTVVTHGRTLTHAINGDSMPVSEAIEQAFPDGGFSWDNQTVRLQNRIVEEENAGDTVIRAGDVITILGTALAQAGIKGN